MTRGRRAAVRGEHGRPARPRRRGHPGRGRGRHRVRRRRDVDGGAGQERPAERRPAACAVLEGAFTGLAALHAAGLVHRDVKPDNIVVAPGGRSRLVDFGLVRPASLLVTGDVAGSPAYMSPEQAAGGAVDARSDVWSCGAVLYEALHGRRYRRHPLESESGSLDDLVRRALASDRELRPADAGELLARADASTPVAPSERTGASAQQRGPGSGGRRPGPRAGCQAGPADPPGGGRRPGRRDGRGGRRRPRRRGAVSVPVLAASAKPVAVVQTPTTSARPATTISSSPSATQPSPSATAEQPDRPRRTAGPGRADGSQAVADHRRRRQWRRTADDGRDIEAGGRRALPSRCGQQRRLRRRPGRLRHLVQQRWRRDLPDAAWQPGRRAGLDARRGRRCTTSVAGIPGGFVETVGAQQWIVFARGPVIALVNASGPDAAARLRSAGGAAVRAARGGRRLERGGRRRRR